MRHWTYHVVENFKTERYWIQAREWEVDWETREDLLSDVDEPQATSGMEFDTVQKAYAVAEAYGIPISKNGGLDL